jgi:hypothetical protein
MKFLNGLYRRIKAEPVMATELFKSGLSVLIAFGFELTGEQVSILSVFVGLAIAFAVRESVTPNSKL